MKGLFLTADYYFVCRSPLHGLQLGGGRDALLVPPVLLPELLDLQPQVVQQGAVLGVVEIVGDDEADQASRHHAEPQQQGNRPVNFL